MFVAQHKSQLLPASGPPLAAVTQLCWLQHLQAPAPSVAEPLGALADQSYAVTLFAAAAPRAHKPWTATETPTETAVVIVVTIKLGSLCMLD